MKILGLLQEDAHKKEYQGVNSANPGSLAKMAVKMCLRVCALVLCVTARCVIVLLN